MVKVKFYFSLFTILFLCSNQVFSQQRWNAILNINPYPSPYISDWQNNPAAVLSKLVLM